MGISSQNDRIVGEFEAAWQSGRTPSLAEFLSRVDRSNADALIDALVPLDINYRLRSGVSPQPESYNVLGERAVAVARRVLELSFGSLKGPVSSNSSYPNSAKGLEETTQGPVSTYQRTVTDEPSATRFGDYQVVRELGSGAFGSVYQARHADSGKDVAIKVLKANWARNPECGQQMRAQFAAEARMMLQFDHPRVVRVITLNDHADPPYFVQEYIAGETLAQRLLRGKPSLEETLEIAIQISEGLAHIHSRERWHRDLKPANILLDQNNDVHLADFGLALDDAQRWHSARTVTGTFPYMAPEQIRGATHLLNARCDLWAFGVILYEMLSGKRPFQGESRSQLCGEILERTPTSPREIIPDIPRQLNRLCMSCLSKRDADRPDAATDVREDLRDVLNRLRGGEESTHSESFSGLLPRSHQTGKPHQYPLPTLRRFTAEQTDLYLRMMPKSYNNPDELPELIGFWKRRIASPYQEESFRVGVMVGVSGCGKSSLLEAGLVPNLPVNVLPILVEASDKDTESRILAKLRHAFPHADPTSAWSLADWTFRFREGEILASGQKVLFILDQFEQWLNTNGGQSSSPLLDALQQCDGRRLQAIISVREGFHATLMRFVDSLQLVLDGDTNYATAHRFSLDHSRYILEQFGRGLKRIDDPITPDQEAFIASAVEGLAESDRGVVCVRLVVLASVMQDRPWTVEELQKLGGLDGIGCQFLVDCFEGRKASEQYRRYLPAAMRILGELLPAAGSEIKDVRSRDQLLVASELDELQFDNLIVVLTRKLFLLTLVESDSGAKTSDTRFYQLTHDFLVPSIREWLSRKLQETPEGRTQLRLRERTAAWTAKPENRNLPSVWEWISIRRLTEPRKWKPDERVMMRRAGRRHALRAAVFGTAVVALVAMGLVLNARVADRQASTQAAALVEGLLAADISKVGELIDALNELRPWADPMLSAAFIESESGSAEQLHVALALMSKDDRKLSLVRDRLLELPAGKFAAVRDLLKPLSQPLIDFYRGIARDEDASPGARFRALAALATFQVNDEMWDDKPLMAFTADHLVATPLNELVTWQDSLQPVRKKLIPRLSEIYREVDGGEQRRNVATETLASFAVDDLDTLVDLTLDGSPGQFAILFDTLTPFGDRAVAKLNQACSAEPQPDWRDRAPNPDWVNVPSNVGKAIEQADGLISSQFAACSKLPMNNFDAVSESLSKSGYRPIRFRPFYVNETLHVAAVWTRDGRESVLLRDKTAIQINQQVKLLGDQGFTPVDVAGYAAKSEDRFSALWVRRNEADNDGRVIVGWPKAEIDRLKGNSEKPAYAFFTALQCFRGKDGSLLFSGVLDDTEQFQTYPLAMRPEKFAQTVYPDKVCLDLCISPANALPKPSDRQKFLSDRLGEIDQAADQNPDAMTIVSQRAELLFSLGRDVEAIEAFGKIIQTNPDDYRAFFYRAILYARQGDTDAARMDLEHYSRSNPPPIKDAYLKVVVSSYAGDDDMAVEQLERLVADSSEDAAVLYDAACAFSQASLACLDRSIPKSKIYAERAIRLLAMAVESGYTDFFNIVSDTDLAPIRNVPAYQNLVSTFDEIRYSVSWIENPAYVSRTLFGLSLDEHRDQCQELAAKGFRPVAISSLAVERNEGDDEIITGSVWHLPTIPAQNRMAWAKRKANAAIALGRLSQYESMLPLLRVSDDPETMSQFIHHCRSQGVTPQQLLQSLKVVNDNRQFLSGSGRQAEDRLLQAILLALGDHSRQDVGKAISPQEINELIDQLVKWHTDDASSAIHAASGWLLRQWGEDEVVRTAEQTPRPYSLDRQWFTLEIPCNEKILHQTYVVIPEGEYIVGSFSDAEGRGAFETRTKVLLTRPVAMLDREVMKNEFDASVGGSIAGGSGFTSDHPAVGLNWFDCVNYCRWLTSQSGLPESSQAYPNPHDPSLAGKPEDAGSSDSRPWPVSLSAAGFRLPTEAEWEIASRGTMGSAFGFGSDPSLLQHYGWYRSNSDGVAHPSRQLRPNHFGLFDMHGNVNEWCHDWFDYYPTGNVISNPSGPAEGDQRIFRGGGFNNSAPFCRSASRGGLQPTINENNKGFRLVLDPISFMEAQSSTVVSRKPNRDQFPDLKTAGTIAGGM